MPASLSLKGRALRYLSAREHSRLELQRKLAPHAENEAEVEALLDDFEQRGWLSTERLVASVVHRRADRFGTARIRQELGSKGVELSQISDTLAQLQSTEFERARAVWRRRFDAPASDPRERARQMRFLLSRGFAADVVHRIVRDDDQHTVDPDTDASA
ncbi:MAG: hypothetical protein RJA44_1265 [Pseudomonadota bacterium]|jgi:regulatory protein